MDNTLLLYNNPVGLVWYMGEIRSSLSTKSIDDTILSEQVKILSRSFIKSKFGLKPLTYVEIVRI